MTSVSNMPGAPLPPNTHVVPGGNVVSVTVCSTDPVRDLADLRRAVRDLVAVLPQPEQRGYTNWYGRLQLEAVRRLMGGAS